MNVSVEEEEQSPEFPKYPGHYSRSQHIVPAINTSLWPKYPASAWSRSSEQTTKTVAPLPPTLRTTKRTLDFYSQYFKDTWSSTGAPPQLHFHSRNTVGREDHSRCLMSPHRKDFKRRRKSKFKYRSNAESSCWGSSSSTNTIANTSTQSNIAAEIRDFEAGKNPIESFSFSSSTTLPSDFSQRKMANVRKRKVFSGFSESEAEIQLSPASTTDTADAEGGGGGSRLLSQPNEYYSKYSRNRRDCAPLLYYQEQSFERTTESNNFGQMKCEHELLVKHERVNNSCTYYCIRSSKSGCCSGSCSTSNREQNHMKIELTSNLSKTSTSSCLSSTTLSPTKTLSASSSSSSSSTLASLSTSSASSISPPPKSSSSTSTLLSMPHAESSQLLPRPQHAPFSLPIISRAASFKLLHLFLSFIISAIVTSLTSKINTIFIALGSVLSPVYFLKSQRHLSTHHQCIKSVQNGAAASPMTATTTRSTSTGNCRAAGVGHRLRRCQSNTEKSDFICIIALGLCLLSPSVTPVITSNSIYPMDSASQADRDVDGELPIPVEGVVAKQIKMPCDITQPSRRDDSVYMILWFRGSEDFPIYSFDVRGRPPGTGKKWSAEKPFGKRAHFQHTSEPAKLIVESAKESDQGIYRCRVDFRNSPSREVRMNLTITVPPNEPQIFDIAGSKPMHGIVGPYLEGANVELQCVVEEGVPSPMVQWYLNDELVDSSYHVKNNKEVINHISVPNLQRSHHRASLSCRASNTLLVPPVLKTVQFDLTLRPLSVSIPIKHRNPQLNAETQYEVKCETWGSHPPPVITWWLDGREEKGSQIEDTKGSNNSISRLFFTPNASVDGQVLTCRADNTAIQAGAMEDSWRLRVVYSPMLSLRMGSSLNPRDIKEGDDVYFECHIRANPQVHKLAWYHNGLLLHHNRSAGVILSNQSLVLQKVSRPSAGNYSCRASNVQGEGTSNHVLLDIMYAPACQSEMSGTDAPIIIAASRSEDVNITCEMDALPDRLKFQWTHTNTVGENSELEPDMYTSLGSKSLLRYHLRSEEDFGTLLCWAHNSIGAAERPCVYQLVPADVPQPVENCSIINRTSTSVEITCEPGFDGGLPQSFLLEAYQTSPAERRGLLYNITLDRPTFSLSRLDADGTFHFKIYSVNRKGRSSASIMDGIVLHYPAMQSAKVRDLEKTTIAIIIGAASAVILGFVSLIAFIIHRIRHPISSVEMEKSYSREFGSTRRGSGNDELYRNDAKKPGNTAMEIPFTAPSDFDEDGDPDIIPTSKNVKAAAMGSMYSRLSNGEINQRYVAGPTEKIPLRPMDPDFPVSMPVGGDPYTQGLPNYATFRGKPNGLGLKQRQQQQPRPMVSSSSISFPGKSSTIVVNIDTRLIGQQLASNQLPESCV